MCSRRDEIDVDAVRPAVVTRRHPPVAEAAGERRQRLAVDRPLLAKTDDHDDVAAGALTPFERLRRLLPETDVARDAPAERGMRLAGDRHR